MFLSKLTFFSPSTYVQEISWVLIVIQSDVYFTEAYCGQEAVVGS